MNCSVCNYAMDPLDDQCPKCAVQQQIAQTTPQTPQPAVHGAVTPASTARVSVAAAAPAAVAPAPAGFAPPQTGSTLPPGRGNIADIDEKDIIDDDKVAMMRKLAKIGAGLLIVLVIGFFISKALQPQPIEAPSTFIVFTAGDKSFSCDAPANWENTTATKGGGGVVGNATFKMGAARIDVRSDLAGSLMGDIARASNAGAAEPPKSPVQKVHEMSTESMSNKFTDYEEMPATSFQSRLGEAWSSEFTAEGGFRVGKIHGYRITMLGGERRYTVICQSPEEDWAKLKPAFDRVRDSLTPIAS